MSERTLHRLRPWGRAGLSAGLITLVLTPAGRARATTPAESVPPRSALVEFVDGLPELFNLALPTVGPGGLFRLYTHPHFGDLVHNNYLRIPLGVRAKVNPPMEASGELQSYFTHGLRHSSGYGLSGLLLGLKHEQSVPGRSDAGWSTGLNFSTPLSRPPMELTDGYRHTLPYVTATYPLLRKWKVVGYSTVGADLLNHTALPSNFGRNQLHGNAVSTVMGAARDWQRFLFSLTATYATTALLSNKSDQVFGLRPSVLIPLRPLTSSRLRAMLTVGGRAIWGPDGRELGVSSSLRVKFDIKTR
ncbi:MAG: hypothetical protein EXS39_02565 [Opitutaceae bacterium]|nr:hypothetical protein [Opitutaceae bacterium]